MSNKVIKYIRLKEGVFEIKETNNFKSVIKEEFKDGLFDTTDYLFEEDKDIRIFVEDESMYTKKQSLFIHYDGELAEIYYGTILFCKLGVNNFRSLSKKNIDLISKITTNNDDGTFSIYD